MKFAIQPLRAHKVLSSTVFLKSGPSRQASLTSAIGRGIRRTKHIDNGPARKDILSRIAVRDKILEPRVTNEQLGAITSRNTSSRRNLRPAGHRTSTSVKHGTFPPSRAAPQARDAGDHKRPWKYMKSDLSSGKEGRTARGLTQASSFTKARDNRRDQEPSRDEGHRRRERGGLLYQGPDANSIDRSHTGELRWGSKDRKRERSAAREALRNDPTSRTDFVKPATQRSRVPQSIPYTTPASDFVYGTSAVTAALQSSRRKLYRLYVYEGEKRTNPARDLSIIKLALAAGVRVSKVGEDWMSLLDKMSKGRPHNGYVLEASPLPKLPITHFEAVDSPAGEFHVTLAHQSREDEAVNGTDPRVPSLGATRRYPFVLMLDRILDPGNLGAIIRSAHFLGVDAILFAGPGSAPLSAVALKSAAGAAEYMPFLGVQNTVKLIEQSQQNGWRFVAAVAPDATSALRQRPIPMAELDGSLHKSPCVLLLGGEGEGIHPNLQRRADTLVGVEGARSTPDGVESLNVSVAAALLCQSFLREVSPREPKETGQERLF